MCVVGRDDVTTEGGGSGSGEVGWFVRGEMELGRRTSGRAGRQAGLKTSGHSSSSSSIAELTSTISARAASSPTRLRCSSSARRPTPVRYHAVNAALSVTASRAAWMLLFVCDVV